MLREFFNLKKRVALLESQRHEDDATASSAPNRATENENENFSQPDRVGNPQVSREGSENGSFNPLVPELPVYVAETSGKLRYLGHSSTYAFTQQVLHLADQTPASNPSPEILLGLDNAVSEAESCRLTPEQNPDISQLPSKDICLHYLYTVRFRTQPLYYLFDEIYFGQCVDEFYRSPYEYAQSNPIWFAHYLVLMAFGKAMDPAAQLVDTISPLFTRALLAVPDMAYLCDNPVESTELCCSITLYLQSIHYRQSALVYVGCTYSIRHTLIKDRRDRL